VKNVKTTSFTRNFSLSFTLWQTHVPERKGKENPRRRKCPAEKDPNRAGATPLFGLSAAQKVLGVAPALGTVSGASDLFRRAHRVSEIEPQRRKHHVHHQEGTCNSYPRI
jgi:hypothetical protein